MGFGGATAAMIASLKNNNRRSKREAFDGWTSSDKKSKGIEIEEVSEEVLEEIRNKLKKQRQSLFRKRLLGFVVFLILISGLLILIRFMDKKFV